MSTPAAAEEDAIFGSYTFALPLSLDTRSFVSFSMLCFLALGCGAGQVLGSGERSRELWLRDGLPALRAEVGAAFGDGFGDGVRERDEEVREWLLSCLNAFAR